MHANEWERPAAEHGSLLALPALRGSAHARECCAVLRVFRVQWCAGSGSGSLAVLLAVRGVLLEGWRRRL